MITFNEETFAQDLETIMRQRGPETIVNYTGLSLASLYRFRNGNFTNLPTLNTFINLVNVMGRSPQRYFRKV